MNQRTVLIAVVVAVLAVAILYPMTLVFRESLQVSRADPSFTLQWYQQLFQGRMLGILRTTGVIVLSSSLLAMTFGLVLAWMIERVEIPFRFLAGLIPLGPLLIPPVVGAAAWAFLLAPRAGYLNNFIRWATNSSAESGPFDIYSTWGIVFVITIYVVPFTYTVIYPALRSMDASLEEAAYVAGAGPLLTARTVTFGLLRPALLGALILCFVLTIAHFTIPLILGRGQTQVLTTEIFMQLRSFPPNRGAATALSMVAVVPSLLLLGLQYGLLREGGYAVVGGKGGSAKRITTRWVRWIAGSTVWAYAAIAFFLPLFALVVVSFAPFWTGRIDVSTFSLRHFDFLFNSYRGTWQSINTSVRLAVMGATLSVALAYVISYLTVRGRGRSVKLLDFAGTFPAGVPTTIFGVGFLFMFTRPPFLTLYNTLWAMLTAYLVIFLPHAIRPVSAAIRQVSVELEDASRMSGSSWGGTIRRITLPITLPSLIAGWILLFVILSREIAASVFLISPRVRVIGVTLFDLWTNGRTGAVAAFSLLVVLVSIVFIAAAQMVSNRGGRGQRRKGLLGRGADRLRGRRAQPRQEPVGGLVGPLDA